MCGLYCAIIALLVKASSHIAAESSQSEPLHALSNGFVASSGTVDEVLSLQESRVPQNDLALNEERGPPATRNFLKELDHVGVNPKDLMNADTEDVIAQAAKALKDHHELMPRLKAEISKRRRMDPTPIDLDEEALYALPNPKQVLVSAASNLPSVLAKRVNRGEPPVIMANTARSRAQQDLQLALFSPSMSSVASINVRRDKKALDFDMIKHPGEVEVRNSKHQHVGPTLFTNNEQEFYAMPDLEQASVWVAKNAPFVLVKRLDSDPSTVIMNNAAKFLMHHDFRPTPPGSFSTSAAAPVDRLDHQLITQEALKLGMYNNIDEVNSHLVGHHLHLRGGNDKSAHPATMSAQSVPEILTVEDDPFVHESLPLTVKVKTIHKAFLEAFNLPFCQYPVETAKMINMAERRFHSSPSDGRSVAMLANLVTQQSLENLKVLLRPDVKVLLRNGKLVLPDNLDNLQEAYHVKLIIMYELFYEFSHSHKSLYDKLPRKVRRPDWIVKLSIFDGVSSKRPISIPHD